MDRPDVLKNLVEAPRSHDALLQWYGDRQAEIAECPAPQRPVLQKLLDKRFAAYDAQLRGSN